ncbi:T9SS type B sorting domain-containing protein [Rhizosphaericola mali]|uniref:T9SS type B sorting domain-containing protein n=1 Tax=Rhizosphaericola mali TaxID=2545455 RepID=A0A5P2FZU1_9BACT|nr:gliding motility-associated C-terminal domain-containing protein [Rhizosphaericola mali]QES89056.1 T9SS type B sorting domain-containing protein [Rhizosphaericola mali]
MISRPNYTKRANQHLYSWLLVFLFIATTAINSFSQQLSNCNNWANIIQRNTNGINCSNISISGNSLTVEALINKTDAFDGTNVGDIVSKHNDPTDCNYLLRPNGASITTSNGFFATPTVCMIESNKTYHVAMTYDGSILVFYRNGIRMSSIACSGTLITNGYNTRIGEQASQYYIVSSFVGYINEVKIWNIARTQEQINSYLTSALPNPTTQNGLLAYYSFDNLKNKQGNTNFDAIIDNNTVINKTVSSCTLGEDPCPPTCTTPVDFTIKQDKCDPSLFYLQSTLTTANTKSIIWSSDNGTFSNNNSDHPTIKFTSNGTFNIKLLVTNSNGCTGMITKNITVNSAPISLINKPISNLVCPNTATNISINNNSTYSNIQWYANNDLISGNSDEIQYSFIQNTTIKVSVQNNDGCILEDQYEYNVRAEPHFTISANNMETCQGESINLSADGGTDYNWYIENESNSIGLANTITYQPNQSETIHVKISEAICNNSIVLQSQVIIHSLPEITISKSNDISCINNNVTLTANGGIKYVWENFPNNTSNIIAVSPETETTYNVTGFNQYNCANTSTITVILDEKYKEVKLFIPSAFTPNNDGKNDFFKATSNAKIDRYSLKIFNRWGNLVFSSNNISNGWNGKYNNNTLPTGTYIYEITASNFCKEFHKKGTLVLIK